MHVLQRTYNAEESPQTQKHCYKNILHRWNQENKYRKSLSDIGWPQESIIQYDEIALEDHSYVATKRERSRNEKSWTLSLNAEGIQWRSDFKEAKETCKNCTKSIQRPLQVETILSIQSNKSDKGVINTLKALENMHIDLKLLQDGDTILLPQRIRLHLRHHDGNQAANCGQLGAGIRGNLHHGVNRDFFNRSRMSFFFWLAGK